MSRPIKDGLYQVTTGSLCAGYIVQDGVVSECAPILRNNIDYWRQRGILIMTWNPFEDDAATEESSQETEQSEPTVVQTADPGEVSLTVKAGASQEAPWLTLRRPTLQGLENDLQNETLERVLTWSAAVSQQYEKKFEGNNGSSKSNGGSGQSQPGKPAKATQAPNGESHTCHCGGDMTYVSGFSPKTQKPYAFFACPKPMGQQCTNGNGKNYTINYEGPKS